jgi:hypothetical protein
VTAEAVAAEIARYDALDAAAVSAHIREVAALPAYLDQVEALHRQVTAAPHEVDPVEDLRAAGLFIAEWLRRLGEGMIPENFDHLRAANEFAAVHRAVVDENASLRNERAALSRRLEETAARAAAVESEFAKAVQDKIDLARTLASPLGALRHQAEAWRRRLFGRI